MNKRILFVDEDQARNGSTVSMEYLVRGFSARGYDVFVLSWKADPQTKSILKANATLLDGRTWLVTTITMCVHFTYTMHPFSWRGIKNISKDFIKFFAGILVVMKAIRGTRPDIVYVNEYSVVQASVASYLSGIPAVVHIRSLILKGTFGFRRGLVSRLILACNQAVFAITPLEAEQLCPRAGEREKVKVVGEFVPEVHHRVADAHTYKELFGLPQKRHVITMLGGIREIKGTLVFLRSAQQVLLKYSNVVFVIAGSNYHDGTSSKRAYFDVCMKVVASLRQEDSIVLLGEITNPLDLIVASDIVVSPSPETHFSRPVIEAWGFSKPVVAARTAHMSDLIAHGINGFLVDPGDVQTFADCLVKLLNDDEMRKRLGKEGNRKAVAEFDAERNLQTIVEVCDALIHV